MHYTDARRMRVCACTGDDIRLLRKGKRDLRPLRPGKRGTWIRPWEKRKLNLLYAQKRANRAAAKAFVRYERDRKRETQYYAAVAHSMKENV